MSETDLLNNHTDFSVVIPICNEEDNLNELCSRITAVLSPLGSFEIILINDGSTDASWRIIRDLNRLDSRIKGISFSRNFGHHIAITAGIDYAQGEKIILMDGDLQDPPEELYKLLSKFQEGYDLVYGIRQQRQDPFLKKVTSRLFWWILNKFSDVEIPTDQTMLRIMSRRIVDEMKKMREYSRFIHGMMAWTGFRSTTVLISHNPRVRGKTKYNIRRMSRLAFFAITSFSTFPLQVATYIGVSTSLLSLVLGLLFLYLRFVHLIEVPGYASIIVAIFFLGGVQLLSLGMLGEYVGKIYKEVQDRPLYIVEEHLP
jgi:dolichol-phosphate mannosyltransferase